MLTLFSTKKDNSNAIDAVVIKKDINNNTPLKKGNPSLAKS